MVEPISDGERETFMWKAKVTFIFVVGLSGGLMALRIGAGLPGFGLAAVAGVLVGVILVWIAFPDRSDLRRGRRPPSRRRER